MNATRPNRLRHFRAIVLDRVGTALLGPTAAVRAIRKASSYGIAHAQPYARAAVVRRLAGDCASVLDVGTGTMRSLASLPCGVKVGLDAHRPYLASRIETSAVPIHAPVSALSRLFVPDAVDLVTMIDFIEHLEKDEAITALKDAELVAGRRVVVFTPRGHFPQEDYDALNLGGEAFQRHRSEWDVSDFRGLGYAVIVLTGFHDDRNLSFVQAFGRGARPVDALIAWKTLA
jgi:hypothetical protein